MGALAGRGDELATLRAGLRAAADGRLWAAVVTGEPGIGKSALVQALADDARAAGFTVVSGSATELGRERPFGPLVDAVGAPPAAASMTAVVDVRFVVGDSLLARIEELATAAPTLLALEDLHWADDATPAFVRDLSRRLPDARLAVVVTARTGAHTAALDRAVADLVRRGATTVDLGPLDDDAVAAIAAGILGGRRPGPRLRDALAACGGNPLFAAGLVAALDDEAALVADDAGGIDLAPGALVVPAGIRQTLGRRIAAMTPATVDVLRVASVLGREFLPAELALVLGRPVVSLLSTLHEAIGGGVVDDRGGALAFRHDLVRDALYLELDDETRAALHREVHRVLDVAGAAPHRLVPHLLRGITDATGAATLVDVGRELRDRAPGPATAVLERALELLPEGDAQRDRAIAAMLVPLVLQGRASEATDLAAEVLARPHDTALDGELVEGQTFAVLRSDSPLAHRAEVETSVGLAGLSDAARARVRAFLAEARLATGDAPGAAEAGEAVREWAIAAGDEEVHVYALGTLAWAAAGAGYVDRGLALAKEAAARRDALDAPRFNVDLHLGVLHLEADEIDDATARLRAGLRRDTTRGDRAAIAYYHFGLVGTGYIGGRWDDARADAEAGLALVDDGTAPGNVSLLGRGLLARLALHAGDLDGADELLRRGETDLLTNGPQIGADIVLWTRSLLLEAHGDVGAATTVLAFEWDAISGMRYFLSWRSVAPDLVRLCLASGERSRAEAVTAEAEEGARRAPGIHSAEAAARRCRGLVDADPDALVDAVRLYRKSPRAVDTAAALEDAGAAMGHAGRRDDAVALLRDSLHAWEALGATFDAQRVAGRLRALGVRQPRRVRRRPETGWDSLTPTERRVVDLVASGLTNREIADQLFVSRYTIETHVKHVFAKLGVSSRIELTANALREAR
ncbi:MAG TPA: AAA family ATPase [Acidimicrobiales bacterium]|nr:AAA family ATPase [Acidimicrobiales bacterium]